MSTNVLLLFALEKNAPEKMEKRRRQMGPLSWGDKPVLIFPTTTTIARRHESEQPHNTSEIRWEFRNRRRLATNAEDELRCQNDQPADEWGDDDERGGRPKAVQEKRFC